MRLRLAFIVLALGCCTAAMAATGGSVTTLVIHDMMELNFKSKADIYELRKSFVLEYPQLLKMDSSYKPSDAVFGQIQDGKPWWGILGRSYYGPGDKSILGPAEESRFIINPYLLVALDSGHAVVVHNSALSPVPIYPAPRDLYWRSDRREAGVTYDVTPFFEMEERIGDPTVGDRKVGLVAYNARDLGWNYLYVSPAESQNVSTSSAPVKILQYIHTGGSCGHSAGCNNLSPYQKELDVKIEQLPAKAYIKLWKEQPVDPAAPADMVFVINMM